VPVGRFRGVPIFFSPSWLIIAAFLTISYGPVVRDVVPGVSASTAYLTSLIFAALLAGCVLAHELGHTAVGLALGMPVRRVVIFLLGGVSEIEVDAQRPRDEFLVSAAGPAVSLLLSGLSALLYAAVSHDSIIGVLLALLLWSNLVVAIFNLVPGLPLDGGRLLRAGVWAALHSRLTGTRVAAWAGRGFAVVVALSGLLIDRASWGLGAGVLSLVLAAYLWYGAGQSLRSAEMIERLPELSLRSLLRPGLLLPPDLSVAEGLRRAQDGRARGLVLVDAADRPRAIVDETLIGAVPPDQRPWTSLSTVARPLEPGLVLNVGLSGEQLLAAVRATPAHEYLVVDDDGRPAGIFSVVDLAASLKGQA
jgi:Zn-dependent protease/CBS domain-containing protein